jgi:hypothetical protein
MNKNSRSKGIFMFERRMYFGNPYFFVIHPIRAAVAGRPGEKVF